MKNIRTSILRQIIYFELIICARGHGIMPLILFNFVLGELPTEEKNIVIGLIISELIAILTLISLLFLDSKKTQLILFIISTILFICGHVFLIAFNGADTSLIPILTGLPFYYMTFKTYEKLSTV